MRRTFWAIGMGVCVSSASCSDDPARAPSTGGRDAGVDSVSGGSGGADMDGAAGDAGHQSEDADAWALPSCPVFSEPVERGRVYTADLDEISGMVVSRRNARVIWVHNDSGDSARVFALRDDGAHLGSFALEGARAIDWEDMTIGPGREPETDGLYLADIGDNDLERPNVVVYRVTEPAVDPSMGGYDTTLTDVETFPLVYPEPQPDTARNAETLMLEPQSGDLFIVTKELSGARVYRARAPLSISGNTLELVTVLGFGQPPLGAEPLVTGGDVSASSEVALRTLSSAYLWRAGAAPGISLALQSEPCPLPLAVEIQGETLAFAPDASGYYTISEGAGASLYFYARQ